MYYYALIITVQECIELFRVHSKGCCLQEELGKFQRAFAGRSPPEEGPLPWQHLSVLIDWKIKTSKTWVSVFTHSHKQRCLHQLVAFFFLACFFFTPFFLPLTSPQAWSLPSTDSFKNAIPTRGPGFLKTFQDKPISCNAVLQYPTVRPHSPCLAATSSNPAWSAQRRSMESWSGVPREFSKPSWDFWKGLCRFVS